MTISATIIADSISPAGIRLTTMQLRYPRFIHAELMTHRVFSRNASSSRAIPIKKMIEDLRRDPAMPVYWGSHKAGMQAGDELTGDALEQVKTDWLRGMERSIEVATQLNEWGLHKQIANRILEPWAHINVLVTATGWKNFFTLRAHPDAQPELHALALEMFNAMAESQPRHLKPGEWHLPYITDQEFGEGFEGDYGPFQKVSVARCARVSYLTHGGRQTTVQEDLELYDRLVGAQPLHASPAEHQATPDTQSQVEFWASELAGYPDFKQSSEFDNPQLHGNFTGWIQYRKTLQGEFVPG